MSTTGSKHATKLYAFLQKEWDAMGIAPTTWCRTVGIPDPTVYRWKTGVEPDMKSMRRVAEALERPLVDVLLAAGYVTPAQVGGHIPELRRPHDLREALEKDQSVDAGLREAIRQMLDAFETAPRKRRSR